MTFDLEDIPVASATLDLLAGGDLGFSGEVLAIYVNGVLQGSCGAFGPDCNVPLAQCLGTLDVTEEARTGRVVV